MLGPFATASHRYIAIHQVSLLTHASYSAGGVRCPRQQRQRVTEGTAMAPWNGPNKPASVAQWANALTEPQCSEPGWPAQVAWVRLPLLPAC